MKIGIDARPLQAETRFRGIGVALAHVLEALAHTLPPSDQAVFYVDADLPVPEELKSFGQSQTIKIPTSRLGRKRYLRSVLPSYRPVRVQKRDVDVFLQYDAALGVPAAVPSVAVFHDLIPLLFRDQEKQQTGKGVRKYKNKLAGNLYWKKYLRTLAQYRRARTIIAISESSRADYQKYLNPRPGQSVIVIPHGIRPPAKQKSIHPKQLSSMKNQAYLLYVGGIDLRKNIAALLDNFFALKPHYPDLSLVVAGKEFLLTDQLKDVGWQERLHSQTEFARDVHLLGFVTDAELAWLYAHAQAFVFPSRYEGFGLPILEAMQAGCPVVAYKNSSIPEVAGDAAILVEDGASMVPAITKVLEDNKLRDELIAKGKARAQQFSWEKTARETLRVLEEVGEK